MRGLGRWSRLPPLALVLTLSIALADERQE